MYGSSIPWQKTIPRCSVYQWGFCDGLDTGVYFSVRTGDGNINMLRLMMVRPNPWLRTTS